MTELSDWSRFVGFYGCGTDRRNRRVVRLGSVQEPTDTGKWRKRYPKEVQEVDCPACGETHLAQLLWRCAQDDEDFDKSEALVGAVSGERDHRNITIRGTKGVKGG